MCPGQHRATLGWSGDEEFAAGPGREILLETAGTGRREFQVESDGTAHIYRVIGPDEYHESVDDNAYTNVMARWNLRRAAATARPDDVSADERSQWLEIADALVDGYYSRTGIYEQFAGFGKLEPLIIADVAPKRPIAADVFLGAEHVKGAQVLKQADVLMLHHLVPNRSRLTAWVPISVSTSLGRRTEARCLLPHTPCSKLGSVIATRPSHHCVSPPDWT